MWVFFIFVMIYLEKYNLNKFIYEETEKHKYLLLYGCSRNLNVSGQIDFHG